MYVNYVQYIRNILLQFKILSFTFACLEILLCIKFIVVATGLQ